MTNLWRTIGIGVGVIAVLSGAALMMGNQRNSTLNYTTLEYTKLQRLAAVWEARIQSVRTVFKDELIRSNIPVILDKPEEWPDWRITTQLQKLRSSWMGDCNAPRSFVILDTDCKPLVSQGDSSGLCSAVGLLAKANGADIIIADKSNKNPAFIALQYSPPSDQSHGIVPGRLVALFDPADVLPCLENTPHSWVLLGGPETTLLSSEIQEKTDISSATWLLLISQKNGLLPHPNGTSIAFQRLQLPGVNPMLLVSIIQPHQAGINSIWLMLLIVGGLAGILFTQRKRVMSLVATHSDKAESAPLEDSPSSSNTIFRQVFQSVNDPLCIADSKGQILKTNHSGSELFRTVRNGKPDSHLLIHTNTEELPLGDFFPRLAADLPAELIACKLIFQGQEIFSGTLSCSRLFTDEKGSGPILLHFQRVSETATPTFQAEPSVPVQDEKPAEPALDLRNPFPIICIGRDEVIQEFNNAAKSIYPQLSKDVCIFEILPKLEEQELSYALDADNEYHFDSQFGSGYYEFTALNEGGRIYLYGYPQPSAKAMEISLQNAEHSFKTLCALTPAAVIIADPQDHSILIANEEAGCLLGVPVYELNGKSMDDFSENPLDNTSSGGEFWIKQHDETTVHCEYVCELININNSPALLLVFSKLSSAVVADHGTETARREPQILGTEEGVGEEQSHLPNGPALVIAYNPIVRDVTRRLLDKTGHTNEAFSSLDDATVWLITHNVKPAFIAIDISDYDEGLNWIDDTRNRCGNISCLCFTNGETYEEIPGQGMNGFLVKPFDLDSLTKELIGLNLAIESNETEEDDLTAIHSDSEVAQL